MRQPLGEPHADDLAARMAAVAGNTAREPASDPPQSCHAWRRDHPVVPDAARLAPIGMADAAGVLVGFGRRSTGGAPRPYAGSSVGRSGRASCEGVPLVQRSESAGEHFFAASGRVEADEFNACIGTRSAACARARRR